MVPRRVVAVLAALWIVIATAQFVPDLTTTPPPGAIGLRTAIIDPVSNSEKLLHLPSGTTTRALIQNQPDWVQTSVQAEGGTQQYLVSVDEPSEDLVFTLNSLMFGDGEVINYIPDNSYLVAASADAIELIRGADGVRWIGPYKPEYKLAPEIFVSSDASVSTNAIPSAEAGGIDRTLSLGKRFMVTLVSTAAFTKSDAEHLAAAWRLELESRGIEIIIEVVSEKRIVITVPDEDVNTVISYIAQQPQVHWVEPFLPETVENQWAPGQTQSASTLATKIWDRGIRGEGEVIAVTDTGVDYDGCFFYDASAPAPSATISSRHRKFVGYNPWVDRGDYVAGHGTHVAGTLAGEAQSSSATSMNFATKFNGIAYKAKLAVFDAGAGASLSIPSDMTSNMFPWTYNAGARIHSNSWGSSGNQYTSRAQDMDTFTYQKKDYLVLKSAGNDGPGSATLSTPGSAKNVLAVGASSNTAASWRYYCCSVGSYTCCNNPAYECTSSCSAVPVGSGTNAMTIAGFSSRGPVADGRIAPHITAPGMKIFSAYSDGSLTTYQCGSSVGTTVVSKQGTSMATPVAAASAALVRQYLREGWYPTGVKTAANSLLPSSALLRAMLINSAIPMTNVGSPPDMTQGYGLINLENILMFPDSNFKLYLADSDSLSRGQSKTYCVNVLSSNQPLKVTLAWTDPPSTPTASRNIINNLDLTVTTALGTVLIGNAALTGGAPDALNTVEQVVVARPSTGITKITVTGTAVPQGPQPFAIAATGSFEYSPTCSATPPPASAPAPCCGPPHVQRSCSC